MAIERTFSIIKPDAVAKNVIGEIVSRFEAAGLRVVASRMEHLTLDKAKGFYAEHDGKPFFEDLVSYMSSGPVIVQVLVSVFGVLEPSLQMHFGTMSMFDVCSSSLSVLCVTQSTGPSSSPTTTRPVLA